MENLKVTARIGDRQGVVITLGRSIKILGAQEALNFAQDLIAEVGRSANTERDEIEEIVLTGPSSSAVAWDLARLIASNKLGGQIEAVYGGETEHGAALVAYVDNSRGPY